MISLCISHDMFHDMFVYESGLVRTWGSDG
jgi:hypothetical protein